MKRFKKAMTAAEAMALLQSDPEWVRQNNEREIQIKKLEAQYREEERPLVAELEKVGVVVKSVWDLVNTRKSYPEAIPVLCNHLKFQYHPKIREGIIRALTTKDARHVGRLILDELKSKAEQPHNVLWALANALSEVADISMKNEIEKLIADPYYKDTHAVLDFALRRIKRQKSRK